MTTDPLSRIVEYFRTHPCAAPTLEKAEAVAGAPLAVEADAFQTWARRVRAIRQSIMTADGVIPPKSMPKLDRPTAAAAEAPPPDGHAGAAEAFGLVEEAAKRLAAPVAEPDALSEASDLSADALSEFSADGDGDADGDADEDMLASEALLELAADADEEMPSEGSADAVAKEAMEMPSEGSADAAAKEAMEPSAAADAQASDLDFEWSDQEDLDLEGVDKAVQRLSIVRTPPAPAETPAVPAGHFVMAPADAAASDMGRYTFALDAATVSTILDYVEHEFDATTHATSHMIRNQRGESISCTEVVYFTEEMIAYFYGARDGQVAPRTFTLQSPL